MGIPVFLLESFGIVLKIMRITMEDAFDFCIEDLPFFFEGLVYFFFVVFHCRYIFTLLPLF